MSEKDRMIKEYEKAKKSLSIAYLKLSYALENYHKIEQKISEEGIEVNREVVMR